MSEEWVKVAEQKPEAMTHVLLWRPEWDTPLVGWRSIAGMYRLSAGDAVPLSAAPTYWMPMPEAPDGA